MRCFRGFGEIVMFSGSLTGQRVSVRSPFVARPANARVNIIQCRSMEAGTLEIEAWDGDARGIVSGLQMACAAHRQFYKIGHSFVKRTRKTNKWRVYLAIK